MHTTILLLGITGNVAKLKVLPGINDFATAHPSDTVDLVGYSRSPITEQEIRDLLVSTKNSTVAVHAIESRTGEYNDLKVFTELLNNLDSKAQLVVYLAVPPSVYTEFIEHLPAQLPTNVHIVIEKPFGENVQNLEAIAHAIQTKQLEKNILFLDHYLFKNGLKVDVPAISFDSIISVSIAATETVGVEDRLGYYAAIGAVQDMLVHLVNLSTEQIARLTHMPNRFPDNIIVKESILGQYDTIASQLPATTPTFFMLSGELHYPQHSLTFTFSSGKQLATKQTVSVFETSSTQSPEIIWELASEPQITIQNKAHHIANSTSDHQNIFEQAVGDKRGFLDIDQALEISKLEFSVLDQIKDSPMHTYKSGSQAHDITKTSTTASE